MRVRPSTSGSNKAFQTLARKMLEQGVGATLLDDLRAAVDAFDASVAETNGGLQSHVLARPSCTR